MIGRNDASLKPQKILLTPSSNTYTDPSFVFDSRHSFRLPSSMFLNLFVTFVLAASSIVDAISVISIKGAKFFNAEGEQVFFKGRIFTR